MKWGEQSSFLADDCEEPGKALSTGNCSWSLCLEELGVGSWGLGSEPRPVPAPAFPGECDLGPQTKIEPADAVATARSEMEAESLGRWFPSWGLKSSFQETLGGGDF